MVNPAALQVIWTRIHDLAEEMLRQPSRDELLQIRAAGNRFEQFSVEALQELQAVAFEHWEQVAATIPEFCTHKLDIANRVWWEKIATDELGEGALHHLRWWFVPSVHSAAVFNVVSARSSSVPAEEPSRQRELVNFFRYAIARGEGMRRLIPESDPESTVRWMYYQDMFPRYVADVTKSRLNRAISETKRNGQVTLLAPLLESLEDGLHEYALVFVEHPRSNRMPTEPSPLNTALNRLSRYIDSDEERTAKPPTTTANNTQGLDELVVDGGDKKVLWKGTSIPINSHAQFIVLEALIRDFNRIVTYKSLLAALKPGAVNEFTTYREAPSEVVVTVNRIRAAMMQVKAPFAIQNVKKQGYRLRRA